MTDIRTHYDNLQVKETASAEVIKGAYKYLSQKWHPDKNPADQERCEKYLKIINQAHFVLSDPDRRRKHDEWIRSARNKVQQQASESAPRPKPEPQPRPAPPPKPPPTDAPVMAEATPSLWRVGDWYRFSTPIKWLLFGASCFAVAASALAGFYLFMEMVPWIALVAIPLVSFGLLEQLLTGLFHPKGRQGVEADLEEKRRVENATREFERQVTAPTRRKQLKALAVAFLASAGAGALSARLLSAHIEMPGNGDAMGEQFSLWLTFSLLAWGVSVIGIFSYFSLVKQKQIKAAKTNQYYRMGA